MPKILTTIDSKEMKRIIKDLNRLSKKELHSGFDSSSHSSGLTNKELASILENGTRDPQGGMHTPPRKFITQAASIWLSSIDKESSLVIKNILQGNDALAGKYLDEINEAGEQSIQQSIDTQNFKSLSPTTLRLKKDSAHPTEILLESGELYQSVISFIK